ncbi:MAG: circularly permuted type 2 ATP-grasp protein [Pseudomonadota bacterium]
MADTATTTFPMDRNPLSGQKPGESSVNDPVFPDRISFDNICSQVFTGDGKPAPHWQGLITYLNSLGSRELERRWQKARQIMHEHGVAYNIFSDPEGMKRPWELDPIPFPITTGTWNFLEAGVRQRTRLLTAIFNDIYGPQDLIKGNHLPPELVFANPGFLRQCHGMYSRKSRQLHFHATDLCRFSEDRWRVVSDRTQASAGAGYALENRIILSRILPRMFHSGKVLRLAPFFKFFTHCLMELSGLEKREPFIVMLSPGPASPTYFEHVFLSRYLGFTLVESSDLTVRNDTVFLKTLGGLHPVDVIWRRIEDAFCDPLALGNASLMGVPGLTQAVRAGNVVVSNPLGSGFLETPGLIPFLPGLCRFLLQEDLLLQDMETQWCGKPDCLERVLTHIRTADTPMIIASAFARPQASDILAMGREQRLALVETIKAAPYAWVARQPLVPCTLPVWNLGALESGSAAIRMFSTSMTGTRDGTQHKTLPSGARTIEVMPGALTRLSHDPAAFLANTGKDTGSKDTWCFSDETVEYTSMMHHFSEPLEIHRGSDLPSRVADNMLWLGRYMERTEGMLRVIRSVLNRINSETRLDLIGEFPFLLRTMANLEILSPAYSKPQAAYTMPMLEKEILESIFGTRNPGGIRGSLHNVKQVAASVRDRLSNDSWQILGRMEKELTEFMSPGQTQISEVQELVSEIILTMSAFAGLALESMTRGMGWRFMDMGRRIERASHMITLLQSLFSEKGKPRSNELEALLEVADSTITYHTRYRTTFHMEPMVDLLLLDELNPRAVGFQMASLLDHVETLPRSTPRPFRTREEKITLDLTTRLRLADIKGLMDMDTDGSLPELTRLLAKMNAGIQELANAITQHYLSRIETEQQLRHGFEEPDGKRHSSGGKQPYDV